MAKKKTKKKIAKKKTAPKPASKAAVAKADTEGSGTDARWSWSEMKTPASAQPLYNLGYEAAKLDGFVRCCEDDPDKPFTIFPSVFKYVLPLVRERMRQIEGEDGAIISKMYAVACSLDPYAHND